MADDNGGTNGGRRGADSEEGNSIWRSLRALIFGDGEEPSLREQIEDAIDEHEEEEGRDNGAALHRSSKSKVADLSPLERQMLRNLLHFGEMTADDVSVPRADIIGIPENASFDELVSLFVKAGHSRLPVYRDNLDEVIGMIHIRDAFAILAAEGEPPKTIESLIRQPRYVPVSMGVLDLLAEMRHTHADTDIVLRQLEQVPAMDTQAGNALYDLISQLVDDAKRNKVAYATEGGQFQLANMHTVICGPGSIVQAHKADEYIELAQLSRCDRFLHQLTHHLSVGV